MKECTEPIDQAKVDKKVAALQEAKGFQETKDKKVIAFQEAKGFQEAKTKKKKNGNNESGGRGGRSGPSGRGGGCDNYSPPAASGRGGGRGNYSPPAASENNRRLIHGVQHVYDNDWWYPDTMAVASADAPTTVPTSTETAATTAPNNPAQSNHSVYTPRNRSEHGE